jgi:CheY-like chemotaxis protein
MKKNSNHHKIFSSRFILKFYEYPIEQEYQDYLKEFESNSLFNLYIHLISSLFAIIIIILQNLKIREYLSTFNILSSLCLISEVLILLVLYLIKKRITLCLKNKCTVYNYGLGITFLCFEIYGFIFLSLSEYDHTLMEEIILKSTIIFIIKTIYVFLMITSFKQIFISIIISCFIQVLLLKYYFTFKTFNLFFSSGIFTLFIFFMSYINEIKSRLLFIKFREHLKRQELIKNSEIKNKKTLNNIWHYIFSVNKEGKIIFFNQACEELFDNLKRFQTNISLKKDNLSQFSLFISNRYESHLENHVASQIDGTKILENIFDNLCFLESNLNKTHRNIYKYLHEINKSKKNKLLINKKFNFKDFHDSLFSRMHENIIFDKSHEEKRNPNCNSINNSDVVLINPEFRTEYLFKKSDFHAQIPRHEENLNYTTILNEENTENEKYFLIGKVAKKHLFENSNRMNINSSNLRNLENLEEVNIYLLKLPNETFTIFLEDINTLLLNERKNVSGLCKSLYLSKLSHEFKNPICNIMEIIENIRDEFDQKNIKNKIRSRNLSLEPMKSHESLGNNKCRKLLISKLEYLKSIVDILMQLIQDFTFYAYNNTDSERKSSHSIDISNSHNSNASFYEKRTSEKKINIFNIRNSNMMPQIEITLINVLEGIVETFRQKISMDNKKSKISIQFDEDQIAIPSHFDFDRDLLKSMIFNIFYHIYKIILNGKIELSVTFSDNIFYEDSDFIHFRIFVIGTFNDKNLDENNNYNTTSSHYRYEEEQKLNQKITSSTVTNNICNESLVFEETHLNKLLSISEPKIRNKLIDDFNHNFHHYLSFLYAKKLGVKLNYERLNKKEMKFFFKLNSLKNKKSKSLNNSITPSIKFSKDIYNEKIKKKNTVNVFNFRKNDLIEDIIIEITRNKAIKNSDEINLNQSKLIDKENPTEHNTKEMEIKNELEKISQENNFTKRTLTYDDEMKFDYFQFKNDDLTIGRKISEDDENSRSHKEHSVLTVKSRKFSSNSNININKNYIQDVTDINPINRNKLNINSVEKAEIEPKNTSSYRINEIQLSNKLSFENSPKSRIFLQGLGFNKTLIKSQTLESKEILSRKITHKNFSDSGEPDNIIRVLLCDDEFFIKKTLSRFLNKMSQENPEMKLEVFESENGFECLHHIYTQYNNSKYFDILIIDETMPLIKGSQIINLLKSMIQENNFKNIIIISYTSYNDPEKLDFLYSQGADYVLTKPINYETFKDFFLKNLCKLD